jgi:hypothetical protein
MLLATRSRIEALLALEAPTPAARAHWEKRAAEDLFRSDAALDVYRPLAEGLATFAEFDLYPVVWNRLLPAPLRWAVNFHGGYNGGFTSIALARARVHGEEVRRRKESLLAQPLSCDDSDGYLAGYLAVKMLWLRFKMDDVRSWTSDQFLQVVYHRFYEDNELVDLLLDPSVHAPGSLSAIVNYMGERIQGSFAGIATRLAEEHQSRVAAVTDRGPVRLTAPLVTEDVGQGFAALRQKAFADIPVDLSRPGRPANDLAWHFTYLMHSRDLMAIGTLPCTVDVHNGQARVISDGSELMALPAGESGEGDGIPATFSTACWIVTLTRCRPLPCAGWSVPASWSVTMIRYSRRSARRVPQLSQGCVRMRIASACSALLTVTGKTVSALKTVSPARSDQPGPASSEIVRSRGRLKPPSGDGHFSALRT